MASASQASIHDDRYCGGKKRQGEGTCTQPAGWGTDHVGAGRCKLHGGCAPSGNKAGQAALVERQARQLFGRTSPEPVPVDNPLQAYAAFAGEVMAWKELMHSLLEQLRRAEYDDAMGMLHVHPIVELYERSMDRANTVLSSYARLNIDERLAKLSESQSKAVLRAIEAVILFLNASAEQAVQARSVAARHLRAVC